ncbi:hypothetical protein, partial [Streptomyces sp. NPDC002690]
LAALAARRAGTDVRKPTLWLRGADLLAGDLSARSGGVGATRAFRPTVLPPYILRSLRTVVSHLAARKK